jgi:hypothetical protein
MPIVNEAGIDLYILQDQVDQNWYLQFSNSVERIRFAGATVEEQAANVQGMAGLMEQNQRELWAPLFDGVSPDLTADQVLSGVQRVWYANGADPVWQAAADQDALDVMVEVGELLLDVIG